MIKISAKLIKNHKTIKTITYINLNDYESENFYNYVVDVCRKLDISTPLVVPYYVTCYEKFNSVSFSQDDFIDKISFDKLRLENIDC